jgi:hypothetical protein
VVISSGKQPASDEVVVAINERYDKERAVATADPALLLVEGGSLWPWSSHRRRWWKDHQRQH